MTCRGPFQPTPFWDCGTSEIVRALGGPGPSLGHSAVEPGCRAIEQGTHKPVLSKLWARGGGERVWLGRGTSISFSIQLSPGVCLQSAPCFSSSGMKWGWSDLWWTLQGFLRWSLFSAPGMLFLSWGVKVRTYEETLDNFWKAMLYLRERRWAVSKKWEKKAEDKIT